VYSVLETGSLYYPTRYIAALASRPVSVLLAVEIKTEKEETTNIP
jgi:hypothetical protein